MENKAWILIVDDDESICRTLALIFNKKGYEVEVVGTGAEAMQKARASFFNLAILDIKLPDIEGVDLIAPLLEIHPDMTVIMATAYTSMETAVVALNEGASAYITKPLNMDEVLISIQRALEQQRLVEEKRQVEAELVEKEHYYRSLLYNLHEDILVIDREYRVTDLNNLALVITGLQRDEAVGRYCFELSYGYNEPCDRFGGDYCALGEVFKSGEACRSQHKHVSADGSETHVDILLSPLEDEIGNVTHVIEAIRDISDKVRAQEELQKSEERAQRLLKQQIAVNQLALALGTYEDLDMIYQVIHKHVQELMDVEAFIISFYDPESCLIHVSYVVAGETVRDVSAFPPIPIEEVEHGIQSQVIHSGKPYYVPDYRKAMKSTKTKLSITEEGDLNEGQQPDDKREDAINSALYVPMKYKSETIGLMQVQSHRLDAYNQEDIDLLSAMANVAAIAIQNTRLLGETRERAAQLGLLYDAGLALNSMLEPHAQLEFLFEIAMETLNADRAEFLRFDPLREEAAFELSLGYSPEVLVKQQKTSFPAGEEHGFVGWVIRNRLPLNIPDLKKDPRYIVIDPDLESGLWVPVIREGYLLGVLAVFSTTRNAFTQQHERLLTLFANQASVAIENARLFEETQRRTRQLTALRNIDIAISGSLDLRITLDIFLRETIDLLGVDAASVLLHDRDTKTLEYASGHGFKTTALQYTRLRLGEGHAGRAALERRIVSYPNLDKSPTDFTRSPLFSVEGFIAYYGVPLIVKGQVQGVLEVFHRSELDPDEEWLNIIETLATQVAIAIDSVTMFDGLQTANLELTLAYDITLEGWAHALELRDMETEGHSRRVTELTVHLGRVMGIDKMELIHVRRGALLHDIGKMGIADSILHKPGSLTESEWEIMRQHPVLAAELLSPIAYLQPALDIPYCHHEKWDGTGYPRGLKGEQIPLSARIFAIVDVWDALRSERPYREAWPEEKITKYIRSQAGTHFDPSVVEAFLQIIKEIPALTGLAPEVKSVIDGEGK